jgi:hypothetical protein
MSLSASEKLSAMVSSKQDWETVVYLTDVPVAEVLAQRLADEGVLSRVVSDPPLLGEGRNCAVQVPSELAHRARWLLAQAQFTDAELNYLATGELGPAE